jgi:hypothetical protein
MSVTKGKPFCLTCGKDKEDETFDDCPACIAWWEANSLPEYTEDDSDRPKFDTNVPLDMP